MNSNNKVAHSYFILPRTILQQLNSAKESQRKSALLKIALITSAYHADGTKTLNGNNYTCLRGEYIGTYRRLAEKTGFSKTHVQNYLLKWEKEKRIQIEKLPDGSRIRLLKYLQFLSVIDVKRQKKKETLSSLELPSQKLLDMTD